ncbi:MAG TPA: hypothetical protein VJZ00_04515 [Thermoanaerobaculia bacterium]|nr:hypothetical protein [Thermoanaerobaculia bacterium]
MKRLALLVLILALPAFAEEYDRLLLSVAPGIVHCGYHSKFDTRLVVYNGNGKAVDRVCTDEMCGGLAANTGTVVGGQDVPIPTPAFIYVPRSVAQGISMSLVVESSETSRPEERSYTELPVVRESDFREGTVQIVGVRLDDGFRKTLRIYGLNGLEYGRVRVRVYDIASSTPAWEHEYILWPQGTTNADGLPTAPSFNMECDLSGYVAPKYARPVRVELEPLTEGTRIWGFVSVTNNVTQNFYTVTPR